MLYGAYKHDTSHLFLTITHKLFLLYHMMLQPNTNFLKPQDTVEKLLKYQNAPNTGALLPLNEGHFIYLFLL